MEGDAGMQLQLCYLHQTSSSLANHNNIINGAKRQNILFKNMGHYQGSVFALTMLWAIYSLLKWETSIISYWVIIFLNKRQSPLKWEMSLKWRTPGNTVICNYTARNHWIERTEVTGQGETAVILLKVSFQRTALL